MPQKARSLSALEIKRITTPGFHAVGDVAGLLLCVDKSGSRSRILRYSTGETRLAKSGKPYKVRRGHGLGGYPDISRAQACEKARKTREMLGKGIDHLTEHKAAKQALEPIWKSKPTTAACVRQRIEPVLARTTAHRHRAGPNPAAWAAWKGNLDAVLRAPAKIKKKTHHRCNAHRRHAHPMGSAA